MQDMSQNIEVKESAKLFWLYFLGSLSFPTNIALLKSYNVCFSPNSIYPTLPALVIVLLALSLLF